MSRKTLGYFQESGKIHCLFWYTVNLFKGKYSKLAQISRNTLVFVEYFQTEIHKEIIEEKKGKKIHSIEDKQRLITMTQKIQRLSKEANDTLTDIENPLNELLD